MMDTFLFPQGSFLFVCLFFLKDYIELSELKMIWRGHKEGESLTFWGGADRISRIQDLVFKFRQFY